MKVGADDPVRPYERKGANMIHVNNKEKLKEFSETNNFFVIIDFDHTLTTRESIASMGIIPQFLGGECLKERIKIFEYYRPLELDYTIEENKKREIMREWAGKSFRLLSKYLTSQKIIEDALKDANIYLRLGAKEFLKDLYNKNVPVIIMSAGVGNLIKEFLKINGVLFDNMILISNFFEIKDGKSYINTENLISSSNKNYSRVPQEIRKVLNNKEKILLCGDIVEDIRMIDDEQINKTLTIGFLDYNIDNNLDIYNKNFDIVLTGDEDFYSIKEVLNFN